MEVAEANAANDKSAKTAAAAAAEKKKALPSVVELSSEEEASVEKFRKMLKMNVPCGAVRM